MSKRLAALKAQNPRLKSIAIVGGTGTGKTRTGLELATSFPANLYQLDAPIFELYKKFPIFIWEQTGIYPDVNDPNFKMFAYHILHSSKNEKTFSPIVDRAMQYGKGLLYDDITKRYINKQPMPPNITQGKKTAWASTKFVREVKNPKDNLYLMEGFMPDRETLEHADMIFKLSTYPKDLAWQAQIEREKDNLPPELFDKLLQAIKMVNKMVDTRLTRDLRGLRYMQLPNDYTPETLESNKNEIMDYYERKMT